MAQSGPSGSWEHPRRRHSLLWWRKLYACGKATARRTTETCHAAQPACSANCACGYPPPTKPSTWEASQNSLIYAKSEETHHGGLHQDEFQKVQPSKGKPNKEQGKNHRVQSNLGIKPCTPLLEPFPWELPFGWILWGVLRDYSE